MPEWCQDGVSRPPTARRARGRQTPRACVRARRLTAGRPCRDVAGDVGATGGDADAGTAGDADADADAGGAGDADADADPDADAGTPGDTEAGTAGDADPDTAGDADAASRAFRPHVRPRPQGNRAPTCRDEMPEVVHEKADG